MSKTQELPDTIPTYMVRLGPDGVVRSDDAPVPPPPLAAALTHAEQMLDDIENGRYDQTALIRAVEEQITLCGGTVPPYPTK